MQVPLDYQSPNGAAISIAVVRLPAANPARRIGSLFLNPGGPGGSGFDYALSVAPFLYGPEVQERFDIVGFDPRGIARSSPLKCFGNLTQASASFAPFAFPMTQDELAIWQAGEQRLVASCDQRGNQVLEHMTTADVARDLDLLRQAVGDDKLTYAGVSYGTYLGNTYVNLFPDKVRAVVIDGVLDPIAWSTGAGSEGATVPFSTRLRSDVGARDTLQEFFRLCDGEANCAFSPNSSARFDALAAKLKASPLVVALPNGTTFQFRYSDLIGNSLGAMYNSASWPNFAQFLAAIESLAEPTVLGAKLYAIWDQIGLVTKRGTPQYPNSAEGFPGVACSDSNNPHSYQIWWNQAEASELQYGYFGRIWTWASSICATWPGPAESRFAGPFTTPTISPVLVIGNTFDPATRYQGAVTVASMLPNSALLTVHGWGHSSLFMSSCADNVISRYLVDGIVPTAGTVCEQDIVPFATAAATAPTVSASARAEHRKKVIGQILPSPVRNAARR